MFNAEASVFVPWSEQDFPKDVDWSTCTEDLCSTAVPSLAPTAAGDLSPLWGFQDAPHWEAEQRENLPVVHAGMLPDISGALQLDADALGGCSEVCLGQGEDVLFSTWADPTSCCCDGDVDLAAAASMEVGGLTEEAGLDIPIMDNSALTAAMLSLWSQGLPPPECMGLEDTPAHALTMPQVPFASSCELARQIAPRPEGVGDGPVRIHVAGDTLDGLATLTSICVEDELQERTALEVDAFPLDVFDSGEYAQKVRVANASMEDFTSKTVCWGERWQEAAKSRASEKLIGSMEQVMTVKDLHRQFADRSHSNEAEVQRMLSEGNLQADPELMPENEVGRRRSTVAAPAAAAPGKASRAGSANAVQQQQVEPLNTFDGFLFSEPRVA
jgi:hypothetical protein